MPVTNFVLKQTTNFRGVGVFFFTMFQIMLPNCEHELDSNKTCFTDKMAQLASKLSSQRYKLYLVRNKFFSSSIFTLFEANNGIRIFFQKLWKTRTQIISYLSWKAFWGLWIDAVGLFIFLLFMNVVILGQSTNIYSSDKCYY